MGHRTINEIEVRHKGLNKYRHIRGSDMSVVMQKARAQEEAWADLWEKKQEAERNQENQANRSQQALERTAEAEGLLDSLRRTLLHALSVKEAHWEKLRKKHRLNKPAPKKPQVKPAADPPELENVPISPKPDDLRYQPIQVEPPKLANLPPAPRSNDPRYQPKLRVFEKIIPRRKAATLEAAKQAFEADHREWLRLKKVIEDRNAAALKTFEEGKHNSEEAAKQAFEADQREWLRLKKVIEERNAAALGKHEEGKHKSEEAAKQAFESDHREWLRLKKVIEDRNAAALRKYEEEKNKLEAEYAEAVSVYEQNRRDHMASQKLANAAIRNKMAADAGAIIDYCEMVLNNSEYPDFFPKDCDMEYEAAMRMLIVDYSLPSLEDIPTLKEVRYIATRNDFKEVHLSERELTSLYDDLIYQVSLRSIYELFEADVIKAIDAIVFNGLVTSVNKATGRKVTSCILSIQATKNEFLKIKLAKVDPKACCLCLA